MKKNILIVAAHADDEVLGCGGTIAYYVKKDYDVYVVYMSDGVSSRKDFSNTLLEERKNAALQACKILGIKKNFFLDFPDNKLDSLCLLNVIQPLEKIINEIKPNIIFTHHCSDLNIDHKITHQAVITICRPQPDFFVEKIYCFETLSSTEWKSHQRAHNFNPNFFVDISDTTFL